MIPAVAQDQQPPIITVPTDGSGLASGNSAASSGGLLTMMQTLQAIQEQLRGLENQVEIENHQISRLQAQQQSFFADFDQQLRQLKHGGVAPSTQLSPSGAASGGLNAGVAQTPGSSAGGLGVTVIPPNTGSVAPSASGVAVAVPPPSPTAQGSAPSSSVLGASQDGAKAAYDRAFNFLREGRYQHAVAGFQGFLQSYPHDKRAAEAQYWVAETDYVEREYPQADAAFKTLVTRYPMSKKVPNALLKIGFIAKWQGHPNKARSTWQGLIAQYPKSMAAQVARNSLSSLSPGT